MKDLMACSLNPQHVSSPLSYTTKPNNQTKQRESKREYTHPNVKSLRPPLLRPMACVKDRAYEIKSFHIGNMREWKLSHALDSFDQKNTCAIGAEPLSMSARKVKMLYSAHQQHNTLQQSSSSSSSTTQHPRCNSVQSEQKLVSRASYSIRKTKDSKIKHQNNQPTAKKQQQPHQHPRP